jgi:GAF domain-containing protein
MPPTNPSSHEAARLADVIMSGVLQLDIGKQAQGILRDLARDVDVAVCAVTIVGRYYQHFKAVVGMEMAFTPREYSLCAHTILQDEPLVIADATRDGRFSDSHFVAGPPYIRFYAGVPLVNAHGYRLGAVCLLDQVPRTLPPDSLARLIAAGAAVGQLIRHTQQASTADGLRRAIADQMALGDRTRVQLLRDQLHRTLSERG